MSLRVGVSIMDRGVGEDPMVYLDDVFRYAKSRLGQREEAEDVAVEVVEALPNRCRRRDLRLYMLGVARRKIATRLRKRQPMGAREDQDAAQGFAERSNEAADVQRVLASLLADHAEALTLKYVFGLTSAEIGKTLGRRSQAVDSLLQRAREAFSDAWTRLHSEEVTR